MQIWEALHPVAAIVYEEMRGGKRVITAVEVDGVLHESGSACPTLLKPKTGRGNVQFAAATASATGQSKRTTNRALARADALGDTTLDKITGTSLDTGVEMDALATS